MYIWRLLASAARPWSAESGLLVGAARCSPTSSGWALETLMTLTRLGQARGQVRSTVAAATARSGRRSDHRRCHLCLFDTNPVSRPGNSEKGIRSGGLGIQKRAWRRWLPDRGGDQVAAAATGVFGHRPDCRRGNAELGKPP